MMKIVKSSFIIILFFLLTSFVSLKEYNADLYLLPQNAENLCVTPKKIYASDDSDFCEKLINELISSQKYNHIALIPNGVKISVKNTDAFIDLPQTTLHSELETVYSLVNSVTSTGDIVTVEFTVNGKKLPNFFKKTSINESFIPDYNI